MRQLAHGFDSAIVSDIDKRLDDVIAREAVSIPWAIESGSRAWGFPSPDSDYDCRFVFVRKRADYLSLFPKRDVIETPLTEVFDVNGWDVAKAIRLLLKGNAVILEWLNSPDVYRGDAAFRDEFLALADAVADRGRIARHYLHLGVGQLERMRGEGVKLKKLFYVLRPAMALRWLRLRPGAAIPPMNFQALCDGAELQAGLRSELHALTALKSQTREMGEGGAPEALLAFVQNEFGASEAGFASPQDLSDAHIAQADAFFRGCLERYGQ